MKETLRGLGGSPFVAREDENILWECPPMMGWPTEVIDGGVAYVSANGFWAIKFLGDTVSGGIPKSFNVVGEKSIANWLAAWWAGKGLCQPLEIGMRLGPSSMASLIPLWLPVLIADGEDSSITESVPFPIATAASNPFIQSKFISSSIMGSVEGGSPLW